MFNKIESKLLEMLLKKKFDVDAVVTIKSMHIHVGDGRVILTAENFGIEMADADIPKFFKED